MRREEILKIAKPILFSTDMVRAIISGRKTTTRRVVKDSLSKNDSVLQPVNQGDILYIRETWNQLPYSQTYIYRADGEEECRKKGELGHVKWKPSIHMPKEAARIFLRVTDVRVEHLQQMPHDGPLKEGIHYCQCPDGFTWKSHTGMCNCYVTPMAAMKALWGSTVNKNDIDLYGWDVNPLVYVITFEVMEPKLTMIKDVE